MGDPAAGKAIICIAGMQSLLRVKLNIAGNRCRENTSGRIVWHGRREEESARGRALLLQARNCSFDGEFKGDKRAWKCGLPV